MGHQEHEHHHRDADVQRTPAREQRLGHAQELGLTLHAGALAHQTYLAHAYYARARRELGGKLPPRMGEQSADAEDDTLLYGDKVTVSDMTQVEKNADLFQISVMRRVKAPASEISLIKNRKSFDYSLTHDGR